MPALALREVRLYGELGRQFGRVHRLAVRDAAEAVRALCAIRPGFEAAVLKIAEGYRVSVGRRRLDEAEQLHDPSGRREVIRIVPVVAGGKSKWVGIILGAALIAASFFLPVAPLIAGVASSSLAAIAFGVGASLVLGGIAQMLTPTPKQPAANDVENKPSYVFNGPQNTSAQGLPVPVGYGRMIVGSNVVSLGLTSEDYETAQPVDVVEGGDSTGNGSGGGGGGDFGGGNGYGGDGGDGTRVTVGDTTTSSNVITGIPTTVDVFPGMGVDSAVVPAGTTVTKIVNDNTVEISTGTGVTGRIGEIVGFTDPGYQVDTVGTTTAGSSVITGVTTTEDIYEGMTVEGATIPAGATVTDVTTTATIVINSGTGVTTGTDVDITLTYPETVVSTTATTTEGSTVVTVPSTATIDVGMVVDHPALPDGTVVKSIVNSTTVVVSEQATDTIATAATDFVDPTYTVDVVGTTTAGSATVVIDSPVDVVAGMTVEAATVPAGRTVSSVTATSTVTIDTATGVTSGTSTAITFVDPVVPAGVSEGGTGNGPYPTDPGFTWPEVPGDTDPNTGTVVDFYDLRGFDSADAAP